MLRLLCLATTTGLLNASALAADLANDRLREQPIADQLKFLGAAIGEGCADEDAYYMGIGEAEGC